MSKYAVVKMGSSQFKVAVGDELAVEKIEAEKGKTVEFNEVLLLVAEKKVKIGRPFLKGAKVKTKVLDQVKGKKIRVATYKAKSRYRRVKGHRKLLTKIRIEEIATAGTPQNHSVPGRQKGAKTRRKIIKTQKTPHARKQKTSV